MIKALVVVLLVTTALASVAVPVAVMLVPDIVLKNMLVRLAIFAARLVKKPLVEVLFTAVVLEAFRLVTYALLEKELVVVALVAVVLLAFSVLI